MKLWQRLALALAAGALAILAFPPFGHWPLALLAWIPMFVALHGAGFSNGTRTGFVFGFTLYVGTLNWFVALFGPLAFCLFFLLALFTGLSGGLIGWASQRHPAARWLPLFMACVAVGIEFYRCEWFILRFPWITPGTALGPHWLTPWIGVYGASFLIQLGAAAYACGNKTWRNAGALLLAALLLQRSIPPQPVDAPPNATPVLLIQSEACDFDSYLATTLKQNPAPGTIVVWPEYAAPYQLEDQPDSMERLLALAKQHDITLILGTQSAAGPNKHHNTALTLDRTGVLGRHHKNRPVPLFSDGVAGKEANPIRIQAGLIGTPVCYDNDGTHVDRELAAKGAQAFLIPSMDPANWPLSQRLQHQQLMRLRAAENGRWMAVAATSGMTGVIDPHGHIRASLPPIEEGVLHASIGLRSEQTFYTRFGWILPWVLLGTATVWVTVLMIQQAKRSRSGDRRS